MNTLKFVPDGSHLLSGGQDGKMTIISSKNWKIEKEWEKAHKGSVNFIALHPTGKLAISMGSDLTLRTWNLINGRQVHVTNLKNRKSLGGVIDFVEWSPSGNHFALIGLRTIEIWSVDSAKMTRTETVVVKPICLAWISDDEIIVGLENGKLFSFNLTDDETQEIEAHENRVKSISYINDFLLTVSSAGQMLLWELINDRTCLDPRAEINIGCRPICTLIIESEKNGFNSNIQQNVTEQEKLLNKDEKKIDNKISSVGSVVVEYEDDSMPLQERSKKKKKKKNKDKKNSSQTEDNIPDPENAPVEIEKQSTPNKKIKRNKNNSVSNDTITDIINKSDDVQEYEEEATPNKKSKKDKKRSSQSMIVASTPFLPKKRKDVNMTDTNIASEETLSAKKKKKNKRRSLI